MSTMYDDGPADEMSQKEIGQEEMSLLIVQKDEVLTKL